MFGVIAIRCCFTFESSLAARTFLPQEMGFKGFVRGHWSCFVRALEFCKMQRCLWNQFVLPNLANSAGGQTREGLWSYSMNKAEWEEL